MSITGANSNPNEISLTGDEMTDFQNEAIAFFLYGELHYVDVFNKKRTTKFRLRYARESVFSGRLSNCEEGNELD